MKNFIFILMALVLVTGNAFGAVVKSKAAGTESEWHLNATLIGGNATLITTGQQTTFLEMTNGSLTLTPQSGSAAAGTVCASTNAATTPVTTATTCAAGNEGIGVSFTNPTAGAYYDVCMDFMPYCVAASGGKCQDAFALVETPVAAQTNTVVGANIQGFVHGGMTIATGTGEIVGAAMRLCSTFTWSTVGIRAIRLMYKSSITDTVATHLIVADGGPIGATDRLVNITVRRLR